MLNVQELKAGAEKKFAAEIIDKVGYIAGECWARHVEFKLGEINEVIAAGRKLQVTDAKQFSEAELKELEADLLTLKHLGMKNEIIDHLSKALITAGVSPAIFNR